MANIKSAKKRAKTAEIRTLRNKGVKTGIKTSIKKFDTAVMSNEKEQAQESFRCAVKKIDAGVAKGVLHKNAAARRKSTLARRLNAM